MEDTYQPSEKVTPENILHHVTNDAEVLAFALLFVVYILIMVWHMQIFRRVFRIRGFQCIIIPSKLIQVHLLILLYLIAKIMTCAYALIAGRIDYENRRIGQGLDHSFYNIGVYSSLLSICIFFQMAAQVLNIKNWLQIMNSFNERVIYKILIKIATPLVMITLIGQVLFDLSMQMSDMWMIHQFSVGTNLLNLLFIQFMTVSSCYIYKFFKDGYSRGQYLIKAITYLNLGLQLKFVWILGSIINPGWKGYLKNYNPVTQTDETVSWAIVWTTEQLFLSVMPTVALIFLIRPLLYIPDQSGIQSVYKSFLQTSLQKLPQESISLSKRSKTQSFSVEDVESMTVTSYSNNLNTIAIENFQSEDLSGFFEPKKRS